MLLLLVATSALAHANAVRSLPAIDAVVQDPPTEVSVWFDGAIDPDVREPVRLPFRDRDGMCHSEEAVSLRQGGAATAKPAQNPLAEPRSEFFNKLGG